MFRDCRGLTLTTVSATQPPPSTMRSMGYLRFQADMVIRMEAVFAADPDFGLAHTLKGYLFLMGFRADALAPRGPPWPTPGVVPEPPGKGPIPRHWRTGSKVIRRPPPPCLG